MGSTAIVIVLLVGLLVIVGIGVKLYDLRRKREGEGVHLQAQVSDALLRDPAAYGMAVTPTARVPWSGHPVILEVAGRVPTPEARERVLRLVESEAHSARPDVVIEDRLVVDSSVARVA
jgi:hypothetical protein